MVGLNDATIASACVRSLLLQGRPHESCHFCFLQRSLSIEPTTLPPRQLVPLR
jgi:hypothetical protein